MVGELEDEIHSVIESESRQEDGTESGGSEILPPEGGQNASEDVAVADGKEMGGVENRALEPENCEHNGEQSAGAAASNGDIVVTNDGGLAEDSVGRGEVSGEDSRIEEASRANALDRNVTGDSTQEEPAADVEAAAESEPVVELQESEEPASSSKDAIASEDFDDVALESTSVNSRTSRRLLSNGAGQFFRQRVCRC